MYGLDTAHQVWSALANRYASPSRSRVNHLRRPVQNMKQGSKNYTDFIQATKTLANQLAFMGKPVEDEDLISSYIVGRLHPQYNPFHYRLFLSCQR